MKPSVPFGYKDVDGKIQVDEINSTLVKCTFDTLKKYTEHPHKMLVQDIVDMAVEDK